ncbi:tRNA (N(6)-L-threonylcarbamoyladenosine(37)-C(2))-methylthiotransferase MtaB [Pseudothermotoga thermarum]|uniref:MiaB-like tRNA modifying enzyme n=1 Tax=Pseudothermotoga thermarum DSM 5069 TaxID=688269 RepID=F7YUB0_9THEM|nr:tRNA (N(6)-L-threonylcarbamoyladenosine(37)-C(2))-methylthiotransferase MtaB [Pseudothermotoga thermarum]AEH51309.1 MiaB-like tRNA modifying enzyme [Pseudothermotoga thermarum DSM 5069]
MSKVYVTFLGCKVNQYETEFLIEKLEKNGFVHVTDPSSADICVVNTCMVTNEAARQSRQVIRKFKRVNPNCVVVAVGCYSHLDGQKLIKIGADLVLGNAEKQNIVEYILDYLQTRKPLHRVTKSDSIVEEKVESFLTDRTRAYVKIEDGCYEMCSYCIVPYARGQKIRSKPIHEVVDEVQKLVSSGYKEIVLVGVNLGKYGKDTGESLSKLIESCFNQVNGEFRIRLSSINVQDIGEDLVEVFKRYNRLCPHLHIPLQSGSDRILSMMNRKYKVSDFLNVVEKFREINTDFSFTTDIIVGFPGETLGDFHQTLKVIEQVKFTKVHAFRFSPRPGTPASSFDKQIPPKEKERRLKELKELSEKVSRSYRETCLGKVREVLVEQVRNGISTGYDEYYVRHEFAGGKPGSLQKVVAKLLNGVGMVSQIVDLERSLVE